MMPALTLRPVSRRAILATGCRAFAVALGAVFGVGCSRIERVEVVNRFAVPVFVRLDGQKATPSIPANSKAVLHKRYYIGGSVRMTVCDIRSKTIAEKTVNVPGDSMTRPVAVIEIAP